VEKYSRSRQATDNNIIQQIKEATCMLDNQGKNTDAFLTFILLIAVRNVSQIGNSAKRTHCCISMATLKTLIIFAST